MGRGDSFWYEVISETVSKTAEYAKWRDWLKPLMVRLAKEEYLLTVLCPVCGVEGILEQRGNSARVVHYEWVDDRRVFTRHTIKADGNSSMGTVGTDKYGNGIFSQNTRARSSVRLERRTLNP